MDDEMSVTYNGMSEQMDLTSIPNTWTAYYSNADAVGEDTEEEPVTLTASYTNRNPESPTSIPSRGRAIVDFRQVEDSADQKALEQYVERLAFESSQFYGKVKFQTVLMPFHSYSDVLLLRN